MSSLVNEQMPTTTAPAISVAELTVTFGRRTVLDGLDLEVGTGESVSIMGPSGSGKTTLLACLLGLTPTKGTGVRVLGTEIGKLSRAKRAEFRARHVGMVFQGGELLPDLTAAENVGLPLMLAGDKDRGSAMTRAEGLLESFGVDPKTLACDLSGGERQRTGIARALINRPEIVLADEPTGSLDAELRDHVARELYATPGDFGCALVVVTHDPQVAALADRELRLEGGRLTTVRS